MVFSLSLQTNQHIMNLSHDRIQQELFMYSWNRYPQSRRCMWHTANEFPIQKGMSRKEHMIILSQRKAIGVLPGVTDLVMYQRGVLYMFDIKVGNDCLSQDQLSFIQANIEQGGQFFEVNTLDQGRKIIDEIFTFDK